MIVVGFDPGYTTGVAVFKQAAGRADIASYHQWTFPTLPAKLESLDRADIIVIEDFKLLPHKAQRLVGTGFEQTIQAVGMIRQWAHSVGADVVLQSPRIKPVAEKWTNMVPKGSHAQSHWIDAYNHAKYYMIKNDLDLSEYAKELKES